MASTVLRKRLENFRIAKQKPERKNQQCNVTMNILKQNSKDCNFVETSYSLTVRGGVI